MVYPKNVRKIYLKKYLNEGLFIYPGKQSEKII